MPSVKKSVASIREGGEELCIKAYWSFIFFLDAYVADLKQLTEMASEQIGEAMKVRSTCAPRGFFFVSFSCFDNFMK